MLRADGPRQLTCRSAASCADIDLHYEERGVGPAAAAGAGHPGDRQRLGAARRAAERLAAGDRLRQPRQRRVQRSTPAPYTCAQLAADAVGLLDALEIERADVFGMSLGGMIAQELALGWPERVDRLVLGCTHCGLDARRTARPRGGPRVRAGDRRLGGAHARAGAVRVRRPASTPSCSAASSRRRSPTSRTPRATAARSRRRCRTTPTTGCPRIEHPTLIVTGDGDRVIPAASSDVLHERIPGSRLEVVAGAGHLFFLERARRERCGCWRSSSS